MSLTRTYDGAEPVRVNKWLAQEGICSRREAEDLIARGLLRIEGKRVTDPGHKIAPGETLELDGEGAGELAAQATYVLHKPVGLVSAQPEPGQVPAARLLTPANRFGAPARAPARDARLAPLGRLDADSRGLLLLSEDGVLAKAVIGPASGVEKEYMVRVAGEITPEKLACLRHGLELDGRQLRPARIFRKGPDRLRFILEEGRNRQIRRMCELVDLRVTDLYRTRIGPVSIGELPEGKWRLLGGEERAALIALAAAPTQAATTPGARSAPLPRAPRPTLSLRKPSEPE